jgi:predicted enzyme related to lactoylglutathione lyase
MTNASLLVSLLLGCTLLTAVQAQPSAGKGNVVDDPTGKGDRLRRPGFLFLELDCHDLKAHVEFFKSVAGYALNRQQGNFVILRSERGEILLNGVGGTAGSKPARYQGPRVEIGIVVDDLDRAFLEAKKHEGWTIQVGIANQPWGVRDFRVTSPEGYYLRITEGPR